MMSDNVLIGVVDDSGSEDASGTFMDNRIGGKPLFSPHLDTTKLNIECSSCTVDCTFLMQIYCPVDQSPLDRVLYLFLCTNTACPKPEVQCFRTLTKPIASEDPQPKKKEEKLFDDSWGDDDDDWGAEPEAVEEEEPEIDLSSKLSSLDMSSTSCPQRDFRPLFKQRFISVFEEPEKDTKNGLAGGDEVPEETRSGDDPMCSVGEEYEKSYSAAFGDNRTNYQFYKRIARCPSQIVRYEWTGQPLAFNDACLSKKAPACDHCHAPRTFELQLMPALVSILSQLKTGAFSLEFETVYVFSCSKNCYKTAQESPGFYREVAILYCEDYSKEQYCQFEGK